MEGGSGGRMGGMTSPNLPARSGGERPLIRETGGEAVRVDPYPMLSDEALRAEAVALGADGSRLRTREDAVAALDAQRMLLLALDEKVLAEIVTWSGTPLPPSLPLAGSLGLVERKERLARIVVGLKTMRFGGLSEEGLKTLARLRGIPVRGDEPVPVVVEYLKARETMGEKVARKGRGLLGMLAEKVAGAVNAGSSAEQARAQGPRLKHQIEEQGLLGGISSQLRRQADGYVQEKLDEIEARIDRKLDEIDRRLCDWRDKEIANRIRILKITLWASVAVAALSLVYFYIKTHYLG